MTPAEMIEKLREKTYLGDGLYAHFDGWQVILEAERMGGGIHWVALDPSVLVNFELYREGLMAKVAAIRAAEAKAQLLREADEAVWSPEELAQLKKDGLA